MTDVLKRPKRKNPVLRSRAPTLPPAIRSRVAHGLTAAAARGAFALQVCAQCGTVQYPPREACLKCLSTQLPWRDQDGAGELLSSTVLRTSQELFFRERTPWRLGLVKLDAGPTVVAHLQADVGDAPCRVRITAALDRATEAVLVAAPEKGKPALADDPKLRDMTSDIRFRKVLVTDGKSAAGQAVVRAVVEAGADIVWVGEAEPWKKMPGFDALRALPQVSVLPLDVTDSRSVHDLASEIGFKVDILINTADFHRTYGISARRGVENAQCEMDVNYFGLLRLAQEFGPAISEGVRDGMVEAAEEQMDAYSSEITSKEYGWYAGYFVLQYVVLAAAWNILGGYCGYVNFGSAAFFAAGAYASVALYKLGVSKVDQYFPQEFAGFVQLMLLPALTIIGGIVSGLIGLGTGYLTLRLRGAFFAIATLALAVVLQTLVVNWDFVGGSRGAYIIRPSEVPIIGNYIQYLFVVMLVLSIVALGVARAIGHSRLGYGFATIRDDELAAEAQIADIDTETGEVTWPTETTTQAPWVSGGTVAPRSLGEESWKWLFLEPMTGP